MMRSLVLLAALAVAAFAADWKTDDNVIIGTDDNLAKVLEAHEFALVEFYAPWCGHCKSLAPEYAKAAGQLKATDASAVLVKVDATTENKLAEQHEIQGYPTLKWFVNGKASDYTGGRSAADIVAWINKKSGPPAIPVTTEAALAAVTESNDVVVLGVFASETDSKAEAFIAAAKDSELTYAISTNKAIADKFDLAVPGVIILKDFDQGNTKFEGDIETEAIAAFAVAESLPLVIEFSDETASKIFGGDVKSHLLMFVDTSDEEFPSLKKSLETAAQKYKGKLLFIYIDGNKGDNGRIFDYFGVDQTQDVPAIRVINLEADMAKYKYESDLIDDAGLLEFCEKYVTGTLKRHLMSEPTPEDWDAEPVKVLTGENFEAVARADQDAFVLFHAPWCGHCKSLAPIWDKLGEKFEDQSIVIGKIDATANEVEDIAIESFPTLIYFSKGKEAERYEGGRDLDALVTFVNAKAGVSVEVTDADKTQVDDEAEEYDAYEDDNLEGHDEL